MKSIYKYSIAAMALLFCFGLSVNAQDRSNSSKSERFQLMELQQEAADAGAVNKQAVEALKQLDQNDAASVKNANAGTAVNATGFPQLRNTGNAQQDASDYRSEKEAWITAHPNEYAKMSKQPQPAMSVEEAEEIRAERLRISGRTTPGNQ